MTLGAAVALWVAMVGACAGVCACGRCAHTPPLSDNVLIASAQTSQSRKILISMRMATTETYCALDRVALPYDTWTFYGLPVMKFAH